MAKKRKKHAVPARRPRVLFLSEMCLLDPNSGAAISALTWMKILTEEGFDCFSVTMTLFDGIEQYPYRQEFMPEVKEPDILGKLVRITRHGMEHNIVASSSTRSIHIKRPEFTAFAKRALREIERIKPDIIFGFGTSHLVPVRRYARQNGVRCLFYLANGLYNEEKYRRCFEEHDDILVPSEALGEFYRDLYGIDYRVVLDVVPQLMDPESFSIEEKVANRHGGFITLINAELLKGSALFLQVAMQAMQFAPELTFVVVESRGTREVWKRMGLNLSALTNVWWLPKQKDISRVFDRTSVLMVPSIWFEASARVVAEAQLCGIPVMASNIGGIPTQLNGGGHLFDVPEAMLKDPKAIPTPAEIQPWFDTLLRLMRDDDFYRADVERALEASTPFQPEERRRDIVSLFKGYLDTKPSGPKKPRKRRVRH